MVYRHVFHRIQDLLKFFFCIFVTFLWTQSSLEQITLQITAIKNKTKQKQITAITRTHPPPPRLSFQCSWLGLSFSLVIIILLMHCKVHWSSYLFTLSAAKLSGSTWIFILYSHHLHNILPWWLWPIVPTLLPFGSWAKYPHISYLTQSHYFLEFHIHL